METKGKECESVRVNKKEKVERSVKWVQNTMAAQCDNRSLLSLVGPLLIKVPNKFIPLNPSNKLGILGSLW